MKLVRFDDAGRECWGAVNGDTITELEGPIWGDITLGSIRHELASVKILPPSDPSKLIAIGLNYSDHAREKNLAVPEVPQSFFKAPSSIVANEHSILLPFPDDNVEHEAELGIIIKRRAKQVPPQDALDYILGYTCANDVSDRTIMAIDRMPPRSKSCDTFTPLGPFVQTDVDPNNLKIECLVNGQIRQASSTAQMIFNVQFLISFLSETMTLVPGDVIITGTPAGVGPIKPGDTVEVRIEGIGTLRNPVRAR